MQEITPNQSNIGLTELDKGLSSLIVRQAAPRQGSDSISSSEQGDMDHHKSPVKHDFEN